MKKKCYQERRCEINTGIEKLKHELNMLNDEYMDSNHNDLQVGEKIQIITPARNLRRLGSDDIIPYPEEIRIAYVVGFEIGGYPNTDDVIPTLKKAKKDGSISKVNDWLFGNTIRKI
jgi:hypothetical protein